MTWNKKSLLVSFVATGLFISGCETMDSNMRSIFAGATCAGIVAAVDSSSDRNRNAVAAGLACYLGAKLLLNDEEQNVVAAKGQELVNSDPSKEHHATVTFPESGKVVHASAGKAENESIEVNTANNRTKETTVLCRESSFTSENQSGDQIGNYNQRYCRVGGDWVPESEARRLLES